MKSFSLLIIINFILSSCNSDPRGIKNISTDGPIKDKDNDIVEFPLKRFSLPYSMPLNCDSNSLIYLKQAPFDTSYLIHLANEGSQVRGVCYLVLPNNHRDLGDFSDEKSQLLFFDGLSFKIDTVLWKVLKQKSSHLISTVSDTTVNSPCFDCASFTVMFDNQRRSAGNSDQRNNFRAYDNFVKDSLLSPFLRKKK